MFLRTFVDGKTRKTILHSRYSPHSISSIHTTVPVLSTSCLSFVLVSSRLERSPRESSTRRLCTRKRTTSSNTYCPRSGRGLGAGRTRSFGTSRTARRTRWNCGRFYERDFCDDAVVVVGRRLWKTRATTETTTTPTRRRRPSRSFAHQTYHGKIFSLRLFCVDDDDDKRKAVMSRALNCVREEDMYGFDTRVMREEQPLDDDDTIILILSSSITSRCFGNTSRCTPTRVYSTSNLAA